jgi:NADPH-dependent 2,4-dienoyl-CoA reductase/sulfur reductase-like enzyme/rhodanese-related sulfurtransferase
MSEKEKEIVVIGGSAAGAKAAAKARRLDEFAKITIIQKAPDLSIATCGFPFYVGGVFDDRNQLLCSPTGVVRGPEFFAKAKGITALTGTEAIRINRKDKNVLCANRNENREMRISYDKLIIATGAQPKMLPVDNSQLGGITTLLSLQDADYLRKIRDDGKIKKAVIIGGGLIGLETCEALNRSGFEITLVEVADQVLPFLDPELAILVENHLRNKSVNVITKTGVKTFLGNNDKLTGVQLDNDTAIDCELAVMAVGVNPNSKLAADSGLTVGPFGGIEVNEFMQTSDPDIYAAGDCVEVRNCFNQAPAYSPMGDLANLEGRVAGENVVLGNTAKFPGTDHTGICQIFDYAAGSTGLTEKAAKQHGFTDYETVINASPDKPGFMGAKLLISKMLVSKTDQRLIGLQCVGSGNVDRQLAMAAVAVRGKLTINELVNTDLPYAPPFSLAIDHFIASAHIMQNKIKGRMSGMTAAAVWDKIHSNGQIFLLDVRNPEEYEQVRIGAGEHLLPLGALRSKLDQLPEDRGAEIICFCKISLRGYEAATILRAHGYTNVHVMEGGIMAWPYPREK